MDITQLTDALRQLGVTPPDIRRASLYLTQLQDTQTFFATTLAGTVGNGGLGNDYNFVKAAVTSSNLLTELAEVLDLFVAPAVDRDMLLAFQTNAFTTYQQYFDQRILNNNYATNVQNFMTRFPITSAAVQAITTNFQGNIREACTRIIRDKTAIENLFKDQYPYLALWGLKQIRSTGSDFHKGGKQVLILTFSVTYFGRFPVIGSLKVVYKPSDIEVDCLLIGDSAAVKRADPAFNITASLTEIINGLIDTQKQSDPNSTLETLPTYRILPRDYVSQRTPGQPLRIRDAYGYIEYLEYAETLGINIRNSYPFGSSDFLIFPNQDEEPIIKKFYRQMGQWVAIACTFSLLDMHLQNVRVMKYLAYLIDLEISLVTPVENASETVLFGIYGGITAETLSGEDYVWGVRTSNRPGQVELFQNHLTKTYQNRLYALRPTKKVVPPNAFFIVRGYNRMMELLQTGVRGNNFNAWVTRLNGVLVRYTPYATATFKRIRDRIFQTPMENNFGDQLLPTIQTVLNNTLAQEFLNNPNPPTLFPDFIVLQNAISGTDYQNVDIPVFYHRIGTSDLVDSNGQVVPIPAQITINGVQHNTGINRTTFFAAPPTAANVVQNQLQVLANQGQFQQRDTKLRRTILEGLGRQSKPLKPGVLIP